jgi:hypothetical protein
VACYPPVKPELYLREKMERMSMKYLAEIHSSIAFVIVSAILLTVTACSAPKWVDSTLNKLPDMGREDSQTAQVYYVITAGLPVYATASASSKVVGRLARYEKVTRTRLEKGYAHVVTEDGRLEGWVDNSRLDWRVPTKDAPAKAPSDKAESTPARSESSQPEPIPESTAPPVQVPAVLAPPDTPVPETSSTTTEPIAETPAESKAPVSVPEPVKNAPPISKKPAPGGDGSKPAPSIFDSF